MKVESMEAIRGGHVKAAEHTILLHLTEQYVKAKVHGINYSLQLEVV